MSDPDEVIAASLDVELTLSGLLLTNDEIDDVVDAVCALPPSAWQLLCARWRARHEGGE